MNVKTYFRHVLAGIAGATVVHTLTQTLLWMLSLLTFVDYFLIWLILLPVPLVLGIVAGVIVSISCRFQCQRQTFILAAIGMLSAMVSTAFDTSSSSNNDLMNSFGGPIFIGVTAELAVTVVAMIGVYLFRRIRN